uniref:Saposin B-type domain-containing protein n=1 Tax=Steinernema glaseri TaxID=37863 RepID=A0A1I7ZE37_9BILA
MRLLPLVLLLLAWPSAADVVDTLCNRGTHFECPCNSCLDSELIRLESGAPVEWISVAFAHCNHLRRPLEEKIRAKVAGWINEECGSVLNCRKEGISQALQACNVVLGDFSCDERRNRILLGLVRNCSDGFAHVLKEGRFL